MQSIGRRWDEARGLALRGKTAMRAPSLAPEAGDSVREPLQCTKQRRWTA